MSDPNKITGLQLRSLISKSGDLELSLAEVAMPITGRSSDSGDRPVACRKVLRR